mmetsp:Transcript_17259/g.32459  ORF Transcript_17259/g.32459 Transcript_17259/m.32459 type:complete len:276 (-) Transcript_17259:268-1095(-)
MDFITPLQFATVEEGIYRGSYPTLRSFRFLERLQLTTIVSLVPEPPTKDLQAFCKILDIKIIHFQINRLTPLNNPNLQKKLVQAISAIIAHSTPSTANKTDSPRNIYVHCLDGRRVTGLLVLLLRRLQNYCPDFSYSEYWRFQPAVSNPYQEELRVNREFDRFVNEINEEFVLPSEGLPRFLWDGEAYRAFPPGVKVVYSAKPEVKPEPKTEASQESKVSNDTSSSDLPTTSAIASSATLMAASSSSSSHGAATTSHVSISTITSTSNSTRKAEK